MENNTNTELIHRLNRAQGQIEAIKKALAAGETKDCVKTLRLLKAANNALKKFGEAYVAQHLHECIRSNVSSEDMEKGLQEVVYSAFSL